MTGVATELTYVVDTGRRPGFYNYDPGPDAEDRAPETTRVAIEVSDARDRENELSLEVEGLEVVPIASQVKDFYNAGEVKSVYYPEVEALVKQFTGAQRVVAFDHNVRNRAQADQSGVAKPVMFVHNDYTVGSGPQRVRDLMGEEANALLAGRYAVINVWKPIVGPVESSPLAVCDATSMVQEDFIETDLLYPDRNGEIYSVRWRDQHRWLYVSNMRADEAMLLKCYDSDTSGRARFTAHSAFELPQDGNPRESIEVRTLAFF